MAKKVRFKLGSGKRFKAVAEEARESGARNPNAIAAAAGIKKYRQAKMTEMAQAGKHRKLRLRRKKHSEAVGMNMPRRMR